MICKIYIFQYEANLRSRQEALVILTQQLDWARLENQDKKATSITFTINIILQRYFCDSLIRSNVNKAILKIA